MHVESSGEMGTVFMGIPLYYRITLKEEEDQFTLKFDRFSCISLVMQ